MTTLLNYRTQNSFLLKPDTWINSSGKLLNLKCTCTSLRIGDSHLKHNSLTFTIPWLTPTRALSPSHTYLWPPCGSLPSTACLCTRACPYPVTLLPIGSAIFELNLFPYKYPNILKPSHSSYLPAYEDGTGRVF